MAEGFRHIIRICGTDVEGSKKLTYGLAKIRGLGINLARAVVKAAQLNPEARVGELSDEAVQKIEDIINNPEKAGLPSFLYNRRKDPETGADKHLHGSDLALRERMDIDFMKEIKCWKGLRHSLGLKVRGQKTRTTGRKGKAIGVSRKAAARRESA
ncbi:30S ribosomal protein S13 [Candidatus Hecatella orcuttiae]|uniref:30S ribosomal protein S13 n=1 Tax=Candidatus Hecatella orcuttiae TaxID=1935119 RepID=UPI002868373F|nr:30S ribosomal protein S13 [Candidatus Hecatella orcuttiae]